MFSLLGRCQLEHGCCPVSSFFARKAPRIPAGVRSSATLLVKSRDTASRWCDRRLSVRGFLRRINTPLIPKVASIKRRHRSKLQRPSVQQLAAPGPLSDDPESAWTLVRDTILDVIIYNAIYNKLSCLLTYLQNATTLNTTSINCRSSPVTSTCLSSGIFI